MEPLKKRCDARNKVIRARNDFKKRMAAGKEKDEDEQEEDSIYALWNTNYAKSAKFGGVLGSD